MFFSATVNALFYFYREWGEKYIVSIDSMHGIFAGACEKNYRLYKTGFEKDIIIALNYLIIWRLSRNNGEMIVKKSTF